MAFVKDSTISQRSIQTFQFKLKRSHAHFGIECFFDCRKNNGVHRFLRGIILFGVFSSFVFLAGCAVPGDGICPGVSIRGSLTKTKATVATLVQLERHASRKDLIDFCSGKLPDVPAKRIVKATVSGGNFSAEFNKFTQGFFFWIVPPLGCRGSGVTDILMRFDLQPNQCYVLRNLPNWRLYHISGPSQSLVACQSGSLFHPTDANPFSFDSQLKIIAKEYDGK